MTCCNFVMFDVPIYRVCTFVVNCFTSKKSDDVHNCTRSTYDFSCSCTVQRTVTWQWAWRALLIFIKKANPVMQVVGLYRVIKKHACWNRRICKWVSLRTVEAIPFYRKRQHFFSLNFLRNIHILIYVIIY